MRTDFKQDYILDTKSEHEKLRDPTMNRIRIIAKEFITAVRNGMHRSSLIILHAELMFALDSLWLSASEGAIHIESIALLRALRRVICPDVGDLLLRALPDYRKIERNLYLIINTIEQLL